MTKVEALKKLTSEITGKEIEEIKGSTISDVIVFLAENYNSSETTYVLPNATTDTIGGVKKCASVDFTTEGASAETCATAIQGIIQALKTAGIMS